MRRPLPTWLCVQRCPGNCTPATAAMPAAPPPPWHKGQNTCLRVVNASYTDYGWFIEREKRVFQDTVFKAQWFQSTVESCRSGVTFFPCLQLFLQFDGILKCICSEMEKIFLCTHLFTFPHLGASIGCKSKFLQSYYEVSILIPGG